MLCTFPSEEFYNGELQTDPSVAVKHSQVLGRLANFWPSGKNIPMMLCNVVGTEGENHTGHRGSAKVGLESKRNSVEAKTIVSNILRCRHFSSSGSALSYTYSYMYV